MKNCLSKVLMGALVVASISMPVRKADAGVSLISGGTAILGYGAILGGTGLTGFGLLNFAFCGFAPNRAEVNYCAALSGLMGAAGIGLIVLDETGERTEFKTIPSYLLDEVKAQTLVKSESVDADEAGVKFIQFTHAEVDDLFILADDFTSEEELFKLRDLLTSGREGI